MRQAPPKNMGQDSYWGRIPSPKGGASIRTVDEYPVRNTWGKGQEFDRGRKTPVYSTNGFPEYSSNQFVFVQGVQYLVGV